MSNTRITQYQALLLDRPHIRFHKTLAINPASLLPDDDLEEPIHDCIAVTDTVQTARPDLTDVLLSSPDEVLFTDGSSYVLDGIRYVGTAVVTLDHTIWAQSLNRGTSAQKAELLALIQALQWGHSAIHGKEGYQLQPERTLKIRHSLIRVDQAAKEATQKPVGPLQVLVTLADPDLWQTHSYTKQEEELAEQKQAIRTKWLVDPTR
ncbi:hypothetical protein QTO34_000688 [Cnephaeus nilssonii]|uniref:RNase H type-1 domain-containing protein n=1 Tax=Cnephaeus nilssonii TaxID=3371016 RepID=A0AA40LWU0_CNENI|nr:hypothetical protein QTO34_000688 [Eptesicus nilssonii]